MRRDFFRELENVSNRGNKYGMFDVADLELTKEDFAIFVTGTIHFKMYVRDSLEYDIDLSSVYIVAKIVHISVEGLPDYIRIQDAEKVQEFLDKDKDFDRMITNLAEDHFIDGVYNE